MDRKSSYFSSINYVSGHYDLRNPIVSRAASAEFLRELENCGPGRRIPEVLSSTSWRITCLGLLNSTGLS